jgi:beta-barrel assembly-enhancing protease
MMFARTEKKVDAAIANPLKVKAMAAGVFLLPIAMVVWGVPTIGRLLAPYLPASFERALAEDSLAFITAESEESELDDTSQNYLRTKFDVMKTLAGVPSATLQFRSWIPNAVTLPGDTIIITDELIKTVGATDGAVAVLAHELAHAKLKHTSQRIFTGTAMWSIVLPMISGDRATGKIAGSASELFLDSRYSRDLEREADAYAHQLLVQIGQNPRTLGTALEQLESQYGGGAKRQKGQSTYASSHPATDDRVEASVAAEASARAKGQIK